MSEKGQHNDEAKYLFLNFPKFQSIFFFLISQILAFHYETTF